MSLSVFQKAPKKPNFLLILVLSGVAIIAFFAAALLTLTDAGKKLLPKADKPEPRAVTTRSMLSSPAIGRQDISGGASVVLSLKSAA